MTQIETKQVFVSPFIVPPGETLEEKLNEMGADLEAFAEEIDCSVEALVQLFKGRLPLSQEIAVKLEKGTQIPADYWNRAEAIYRQKLEALLER